MIRGIEYSCKTCGLDFCHKCYAHRDLIHSPHCEGTEFEEFGPEFEEEPSASAAGSGTVSSGDTSSSDSDSD